MQSVTIRLSVAVIWCRRRRCYGDKYKNVWYGKMWICVCMYVIYQKWLTDYPCILILQKRYRYVCIGIIALSYVYSRYALYKYTCVLLLKLMSVWDWYLSSQFSQMRCSPYHNNLNLYYLCCIYKVKQSIDMFLLCL